ncbi:hypothetical protein D3C77_499360 [compost metagenome]
MNRKVRRHFPNHFNQSQILHDHRVHARIDASLDQFSRIPQFILKHENIEGQEPLDPIAVQKSHDFRELVHAEVVRPGSSIELFYTKKNRIRPIRHRGSHTIPIARRRQELHVLPR